MVRKTKFYPHVRIIDIGHKGLCIGRTPEGEIVSVMNSLPGEIIAGDSRRKKKGLPLVRVQEVIQSSPDATMPRCAHFGLCGGCKWQHLVMDAQLKFKEKQVHDAMKRIGGVEDYEARPIVASPQVYAFRNKMEFSFSNHRWLSKDEIATELDIISRNALGLHPTGRFDRVVDVDKCHLVPEEVNEVRNFIRDRAIKLGLSFYDQKNHVGSLRSLIIRNNRQGELMVTMVFGEEYSDLLRELLHDIKHRFSQIISLYYIINKKKNDSIFDLELILFAGQKKLIEKIGEKIFEIGPKSFFQTNIYQTEQLYEAIKEEAAISHDDIVYDLYTGLGSIAIYLSDDSNQIFGVEEIPQAIGDARHNATLNDCTSLEFLAGKMEHLVVNKKLEDWPSPDVIITDPPRAGMHKDVVEFILDQAPRKIVYVSCDPATQSRDIKLLSSHYRLVSVQPFDMFPHTSHVESLAVMIKD